MANRRIGPADWRWILLPIALFAFAVQIGGTSAAAQAGWFPRFMPRPVVSRFPDIIPMPVGVTPRGVAVDKVGNVYVSVGVVRTVDSKSLEFIQVRKYAPDGEWLADVEIGQGTIGGLMVDACGDLYIALAAGKDRGVYRMDRVGQIELLPGSQNIFFANGFAFDDWGTLYVTESVSMTPSGPGPGGIWRIPRGGEAELCVRDVLLTGTGALGQPVPIGANGIAYYLGNLFVTNTEKGTVLRISAWPHRRVGLPRLWTTLKEVPEALEPLKQKFPVVMGDGIALDAYGNLYVAVLTRSAIVRINPRNKTQETVAAFPESPLDFPASLFFGTTWRERGNLFVTNLGMGNWIGPSLVKIDADVPGPPRW